VKPRFHEWTSRRSAKPPFVNARSRFSVEALVVYVRHSRRGSGIREASVKAYSLTASPR
jgi:hypothetical protein